MSPRQYLDVVPSTIYDRGRTSAFAYTCRGCSKCCYGKVIRIGPYEALRLSRQLGVSTTVLLRDCTEAGGTVLRTRADGSCIFLEQGQCSVHAQRPLACRIYPLAWYVDGHGNESFGLLSGHPESAGELGTSGTIDEYCQSQELDPYLTMVRRYVALYDRLLRTLELRDNDDLSADLAGRRHDVDRLDAGGLASPWLDVDAVVATYCAAHDRDVPTDFDTIIELHVSALDEWIEKLRQQHVAPG